MAIKLPNGRVFDSLEDAYRDYLLWMILSGDIHFVADYDTFCGFFDRVSSVDGWQEEIRNG